MTAPTLYAVSTDRNYAADMANLLLEVRDPAGWINAVTAQQLIDDLIDTDPDLLYGWMRTLAIPMIARLIASGSR